ncbi:hypothetical protein Trydic_g18817 [Trypoxylus dichotomus]
MEDTEIDLQLGEDTNIFVMLNDNFVVEDLLFCKSKPRTYLRCSSSLEPKMIWIGKGALVCAPMEQYQCLVVKNYRRLFQAKHSILCGPTALSIAKHSI